MFVRCKTCGCLTTWGTVANGNVYCEYCIKEQYMKKVTTRPKEAEYQTFMKDFKKRWPTMSAFAKQYNFKAEMVQRTLKRNKKGKLTKTQSRVIKILIERGFAKMLIIDEIISIDDVITIGSSYYKELS